MTIIIIFIYFSVDEIENLKRETRVLKQIREAIGTPDYSQKVFRKVFTDDINRLLRMEDMWKTRKPPVPLRYEDIENLVTEGNSQLNYTENSNTLKDQRVWSLAENFVVFLDRSAIIYYNVYLKFKIYLYIYTFIYI